MMHPHRGTPPTYSLYVVTDDGEVLRVGPRGLDYHPLLTGYGRLITSAMHRGRLPGYKNILVRSDAEGQYGPDCPDLMVPSTVFDSPEAAGHAISEHLGDTILPNAEVAAWARRRGVLSDWDDRAKGYVLLTRPRPERQAAAGR